VGWVLSARVHPVASRSTRGTRGGGGSVAHETHPQACCFQNFAYVKPQTCLTCGAGGRNQGQEVERFWRWGSTGLCGYSSGEGGLSTRESEEGWRARTGSITRPHTHGVDV
jgi:hypothetical protein